MTQEKKILIVDDHPIFCWGLSELINLEKDLIVCGTADSASLAMVEIERLSPHLIIADITLKNSDGIELVRDVCREFPQIPVFVLSMHDELLYAQRAIHAGARGYIMKQEAMESVVTAIRQVLKGKMFLNENVKEHILSNLSGFDGNREDEPEDRLTGREKEVFRLIGGGLSSREIADALHLSIKTIGTYRERIKEKFGIKHATELVRYAVHWQSTKGTP